MECFCTFVFLYEYCILHEIKCGDPHFVLRQSYLHNPKRAFKEIFMISLPGYGVIFYSKKNINIGGVKLLWDSVRIIAKTGCLDAM